MPKITFLPSKKEIEAESGTTILMAATRNGIRITHECTEGICGTCALQIVSGVDNVNPSTEEERDTVSSVSDDEGARLGCLLVINGDVELRSIH